MNKKCSKVSLCQMRHLTTKETVKVITDAVLVVALFIKQKQLGTDY